eukprot:8849120-Lingulodinium_polyedra.AAC.1
MPPSRTKGPRHIPRRPKSINLRRNRDPTLPARPKHPRRPRRRPPGVRGSKHPQSLAPSSPFG